MLKYIIAWIPLVFIAIANGLLREHIIANRVTDLHAHQISTATFLLFFSVYTWFLLSTWRPASTEAAIHIGLIWLGLTVAFEFLFGHYVAGHSWSRLLHDYNIFAGRVWILVPIWVCLAPYVFYQLQK